MKSLKIKLDTIDKVKKFVNIISMQDGDFDLACDRYRVDAKSIMGIFSLDLTKDLALDIYDDNDFERIKILLEPYIY